MATEQQGLIHHGAVAAADLSNYQYYMVKLSASGWALCTVQGEGGIIGILLNDPESGEVCNVMLLGKGKALLGGTVALGDPLCVNADSVLIEANDQDEFVLGRSLVAGVADDVAELVMGAAGGAAAGAIADQEAYVSSANYSSTGQYTAVKPHTTAGQIVQCSTAGEKAFGILQNAPASLAEAEICTYGQCTGAAGTGNLTAGQAFTTDSNGELIGATGDQAVLGWAEAAITDGSSGAVFVAGGSVTTATNLATTAAGDTSGDLIYRDSATTFERLAKGTTIQMLAMNVGATAPEWIAQSAVTAGDVVTTAAGDAIGDLLYRDATTTLERLAIGTAAQILATNGGATAPEWIAQSAMTVGACTLAASSTDVETTAAGDAIGDLLFRDAAATIERLAIGTAAQILATNGGATAPEWIAQAAMTVGACTLAASSTDVETTSAGDAIGDLLFRDAAATIERLAIGTAAQILATNGGATAPEWIAQAAMTVGACTLAASSTDVVTTTAGDAIGDLVFRDAAATLERLAIGDPGRVLRVNSAGDAPEWSADKIVYEDFGAYAATDQVANIIPGAGTAFSGATDVLHHCYTPAGNVFCVEALGAGQTIEPVISADGLDMAGDQANDEGYEIFSHFLGASGRPFRIGEPAFYFYCQFLAPANADGTDDFQMGFRRAETCVQAFDDYNDAATLGGLAAASPMAIWIATINDGAGTVETNTTQTMAGARSTMFKVLVDAAGAVTYQHDLAVQGTLAAPTVTAAYSLDPGDPVIPFFRVLQVVAPGTGAMPILVWKAGYQ